MKVQIGNSIYDADREPIMIILTDQDKKNIANMDKCCSKYVVFPDDFDKQEIKKWAE